MAKDEKNLEQEQEMNASVENTGEEKKAKKATADISIESLASLGMFGNTKDEEMTVASKCKICGGKLKDFRSDSGARLQCVACKNLYEVKQEKAPKYIKLLEEAYGHLSRGELEEAGTIFEEILEEYPNDYEAYMGLAYANHGVVYVLDKKTNKKIPTCFNTPEPFSKDHYYLKAIEYAPADIQDQYKQYAQALDEIRLKWMEISKNEKPYDIFISFKKSEIDNPDKDTPDVAVLHDLYVELLKREYKVFFSPETLKSHGGENFEPYIYNALATSKVMIVYGSNPDYFKAAWVKNEWKRWYKMKDHISGSRLVVNKCPLLEVPLELRDGNQCFDAINDSMWTTHLIDRIKVVVDTYKQESGVTRTNVKTYNSGDKRTVLSGEHISKAAKVFTAKTFVAANKMGPKEINRREIGGKTLDPTSSVVSIVNTANMLWKQKGWDGAISSYKSALASSKEEVPDIRFNMLLCGMHVLTPEAFTKKSTKFSDFDEFDSIIANSTEETLDKCANMMVKSAKYCFENKAVKQGLSYFLKLVEYNLPQRKDMLDVARQAISNLLKNKNVDSLQELIDAYIEKSDEDYIECCTDLLDLSLENGQIEIAKIINKKIIDVNPESDEYYYNAARIQLKSPLWFCPKTEVVEEVLEDGDGEAEQEKKTTEKREAKRLKSSETLLRLPDFKDIENMLKYCPPSRELFYNELLVDAIYKGVRNLYKGRRKGENYKSKIIQLFKLLISYSYPHYILKEKETTEAEFKYFIFNYITQHNVKKKVFEEIEIDNFKGHILKTLEEDAVDEYTAYYIAHAVYNMRCGKFAEAERLWNEVLVYIPNDVNARILRLCSLYKISEKDILKITDNSLIPFDDKKTSKKPVGATANNYIVYALLSKLGQRIMDGKFLNMQGGESEFVDILEHCKTEETAWKEESRSNFYIKNTKDDIYYKYLCDFKYSVKESTIFEELAEENQGYLLDAKTQYDYYLKLFSDEILRRLNDIKAGHETNAMTKAYYEMLRCIEATNKGFMCERLKMMGDFMLSEGDFNHASEYYGHAIQENPLDVNLFWKRLQADFKVKNVAELILLEVKAPTIKGEISRRWQKTMVTLKGAKSSKKSDSAENAENLELIDYFISDENYLKLLQHDKMSEEDRSIYVKLIEKRKYIARPENRKLRILLSKERNNIPYGDLNQLLRGSDEEFKEYLLNLKVREENKRRSNAKAIGKTVHSVQSWILGMVFLAAFALLGAAFASKEILHNENGFLPRKIASIITIGLLTLSQVVAFFKNSKSKLIINTLLLGITWGYMEFLLQRLVIEKLGYIDEVMLTATMLWLAMYILASTIRLMKVKAKKAKKVWGVFAKSLSFLTIVVAFTFIPGFMELLRNNQFDGSATGNFEEYTQYFLGWQSNLALILFTFIALLIQSKNLARGSRKTRKGWITYVILSVVLLSLYTKIPLEQEIVRVILTLVAILILELPIMLSGQDY